jgi:hypothetical protein
MDGRAARLLLVTVTECKVPFLMKRDCREAAEGGPGTGSQRVVAAHSGARPVRLRLVLSGRQGDECSLVLRSFYLFR